MQIIPKAAGRDVFDRVKGIDGELAKTGYLNRTIILIQVQLFSTVKSALFEKSNESLIIKIYHHFRL